MIALTLLVVATPFQSVDLEGFPHVKQKPDFCGEADVEMFMRKFHYDVDQDDVFVASGVDPAKGRGVVTDELARTLRSFGIEPGQVWYHDSVDKQFAALHADLVAGQPSIVCMHYNDQPNTTEHFRLVTGYDADSDEVIYNEPAEKDGAHRRMKRALFEKLWTFRPSADRISVIRFRMPAPKEAPHVEKQPGPSAADAVQHVMEMNDRGELKHMSVVWEKPFLVVGDEGADMVKQRSRSYVKWTRDLLLKDFFDEAPSHLQEVWILKDDASYRKTSKALFQQDPDTPYGYYLASRRALVMDIKPGYGTLTHELVHPFFEQAWGEAPPWMNEGVASLFERPAEKNGHLVGKVNWRLPGLLTELKSKEGVPSFETLTHYDSEAFYGGNGYSDNYAQSRYLCYWLQEKGLLAKVVKRAHELKDTDKSGYTALTEVLGKDPDSFKDEWIRFVKALASSS